LIEKTSPVIAALDEDSDDRILLQQAFEQCRQGIEVHTFQEGEDLLDFLKKGGQAKGRRTGPADLIVLGLHLPWESTFDLLATIKSDPYLRPIPIIVLISLVPDAVVRRVYDLGANTVITRPVLWDELVSVLKKTCDYWFGPLKM